MNLLSNDPHVIFSYMPLQHDDMERSAEMCSLEMIMLQRANMTDKMVIMADTLEDGLNAKLIPCCAMEMLLSSTIVPRHWKVCVSGHTSVLLVFHEAWKIWEQADMDDPIRSIAKWESMCSRSLNQSA